MKAAIDSLPVVLTPGLLEALFGNHLAESWVWLLVHAPFRDPTYLGLGSEKKANVGWFTRGQPLGCSWPMFTLMLARDERQSGMDIPLEPGRKVRLSSRLVGFDSPLLFSEGEIGTAGFVDGVHGPRKDPGEKTAHGLHVQDRSSMAASPPFAL